MARRLRAWLNLFLMTQGEYEKKTNISWRYTMCQAWKRCFLECMSYTLRKYLGHWGYFWLWTPANLLKWRYCVTGTMWHWRLCTHYNRWPSDFQGSVLTSRSHPGHPFFSVSVQCPLSLRLRPHAPVTAADSHSSLFLPSLPSMRFSFFISSPVTSSPFLGLKSWSM